MLLPATLRIDTTLACSFFFFFVFFSFFLPLHSVSFDVVGKRRMLVKLHGVTSDSNYSRNRLLVCLHKTNSVSITTLPFNASSPNERRSYRSGDREMNHLDQLGVDNKSTLNIPRKQKKNKPTVQIRLEHGTQRQQTQNYTIVMQKQLNQ